MNTTLFILSLPRATFSQLIRDIVRILFSWFW
jgi:hypothetical protein